MGLEELKGCGKFELEVLVSIYIYILVYIYMPVFTCMINLTHVACCMKGTGCMEGRWQKYQQIDYYLEL